MAKTNMSASFAKFASKTTKGAYDEARKGERFGSGVPFPVGTTGTAVVSAIICDETNADDNGEKHPRVRVELSVLTPEGGKGKTLSGSGLMQVIKDGRNPEKWNAAMAFGAMLGMLENLGLPESISKGYSDFQECVDFFTDEERLVNFEVQENNYTGRNGREVQGKQVAAFAIVDEANIPTADNGQVEVPEGARLVNYRGSKHIVIDETEGMFTLKSVASGRVRTDVAADNIEDIS